MFSATRARLVANRQIRRLGGRVGALVRSGRSRRVMVALVNYRPKDFGGLVEQGDRRAIVSAIAPDGTLLNPPPDKELDKLVTYAPGTATVDAEYKILFVGKEEPSGVVILWDMPVRGS